MAFSFTGLSFLIGSIVVFFLTVRFFRYWMQERSLTGRMLFFFALFFLIFFALTAVLTLFFARSTFVLKLTVIIAIFLQGIALSFLGYLLLRLKIPSISPLMGPACILLLSGASAILAILIPFAPRLDEGNLVIQWNAPLVVSMPRMFIFFVTLLPLAWVFFQEYRITQDSKSREKALGMAVVMVMGFLMSSFDFVLEQVFGLSEVVSDIFLNVTFAILLVVVLFPFWSQRKEVV